MSESQQQGNVFAVPENWTSMTEDEQDAWVEAMLIQVFDSEV